MFFTYIIQSEIDSGYYVGHMDDLVRRLKEHNGHNCRYTSKKKPWRIVYFEEYATNSEATKREYEIKKKKSRKYIEKLIEKGSSSSGVRASRLL